MYQKIARPHRFGVTQGPSIKQEVHLTMHEENKLTLRQPTYFTNLPWKHDCDVLLQQNKFKKHFVFILSMSQFGVIGTALKDLANEENTSTNSEPLCTDCILLLSGSQYLNVCRPPVNHNNVYELAGLLAVVARWTRQLAKTPGFTRHTVH